VVCYRESLLMAAALLHDTFLMGTLFGTDCITLSSDKYQPISSTRLEVKSKIARLNFN
jgi:hypothetical protein